MSAPERKLEHGRVGESIRRVDAIPKVAGEFAYASDLFAAGMLFGHTLRSPHAAARIKRIDTAEARGMPGVHAVLTHKDVPGEKRYGLEFADQPVLAMDDARYFGEPVAVVAAEHPEQARRASERIHVEYIPQQPVVAAERAKDVLRELTIQQGDPFAKGDVAVKGVYELGIQDQAFLGPESGLAVPDGKGGVDIYVATQWLHVDRDQVAPCLGLEPEEVRIHLAGVGGAFGGREDLSMQIHGALLALKTNRPVKLVYNRQESFAGHVHRHPAKIWAEHRANRDGKLVNVRMRIPSTVARTHRARPRSARTPPRSRVGRTRSRTRSSSARPSTRTTRRAARCGASARFRRVSPRRRRWTGSPWRSSSIPWSSAFAMPSPPGTRCPPGNESMDRSR